MKTKLFILIFLLLAGQMVYPQTYTMPAAGTQTDTTCSGLFYDSGGPTVNYANNSNGIMVFCPAVAGQYVSFNFTSISLADAGERLRIFSGIDTITNPVPLFNLAGPTSSAGCGTVVISNVSNGCLTVHFRSNAVSNAAGWSAILDCQPSPSVGPPAGSTCANPRIIPSVPFAETRCTQCLTNDYQSQSGICNTTYSGEDLVYSYTTTGSETVCITLSGTTGNPTLAIYSGCPGSGGVCLTPTPMIGNSSMQFTFPAAGTYYIIIDEAGGPTAFSCYDLSIVPCLIGINETTRSDQYLSVTSSISSDQIMLSWNSTGKLFTIHIYDCRGKLLHSESVKENHAVFNTASLAEGMYFVTVTDENKNPITKKFVKM